MFDKSDPYAEVRWNGELIGRSRVMEDATSPEWNESFVIRVAPTQQNVLSIELFDFDGDLFELKNNLITPTSLSQRTQGQHNNVPTLTLIKSQKTGS